MAFFSRYRLHATLAWWLAFLAVWWLTGAQGTVQDIAWQGPLALIAVGRHGGVRLVDVADPARPLEVGHFDTLGDARAVAWMGNLALVADGPAGLSVLDCTNPAQPVEIGYLAQPAPVQDVAADLEGGRAFLALGQAGWAVVDLSDPAHPHLMNQVRMEAAIEHIRYRSGRLYLASGGSVWLVDVLDPTQPMVLGQAGTPANTDLTVVSLDLLATARRQEGGLRLIRTDDPRNPQIAADFPSQAQVDLSPIEARAVTAVGRTVFVGGSKGHLYQVEALDPARPTLRTQGMAPGAVTALAVQGDYLAVGTGPFGVQWYATDDLSRPLGWYDTPGDYTLGQWLRALRHPDPRPLTARKSMTTLLLWGKLLLLFLAMRYGAVGFFAQFVLPVHTLADRWNAARYLNLYIRGRHGPALFVQNGRLIEREGEHEKRGPGVIILDTASAAMLRTKTRYTRAVGPGLVFTQDNEYIAETVALFPQFQALGPTEPVDMDDFETRLAGREPLEDHPALTTRAQTRDDVAVVARIGVAFRLDFDPPTGTQTLGGSRYGFDPDAVRKAVMGGRIDPTIDESTEEKLLPWDRLPAFLAVELWREYLHKFRFDELFDHQTGPKHRLTPAQPSAGEPVGETGLEIIQRLIKDRLTKPMVLGLDDNGFPGIEVESMEYRLLKERGIRVVGVSISGLQFRSSVERNLLRAWSSSWLKWAEEERRAVDSKRAHAEHRGREQGERDFALRVSNRLMRFLYGDIAGTEDGSPAPLRLDEIRPNVPEKRLWYSRAVALTWMVEDTRRLILREPDVHRMLEGAEDDLTYLLSWCRQWRSRWQ